MGNKGSAEDPNDVNLPADPGFGSYKIERNNKKLTVYDPSSK